MAILSCEFIFQCLMLLLLLSLFEQQRLDVHTDHYENSSSSNTGELWFSIFHFSSSIICGHSFVLHWNIYEKNKIPRSPNVYGLRTYLEVPIKIQQDYAITNYFVFCLFLFVERSNNLPQYLCLTHIPIYSQKCCYGITTPNIQGMHWSLKYITVWHFLWER